MNKTSTFLLYFLLIQTALVYSQDGTKIKDVGTPFIEGFTAEEYLGHNQAWQITQDLEGLIYVANQSGLSQFDGKKWKQLSSETSRSIKQGPDQKIYVGHYNDISVLVIDSTNTYVPKSLVPKLPLEYQKVRTIHQIEVHKDNMVFMSLDALFIYHIDSDTFSVLPASDKFITFASFDNRLVVFDSEKGLLEYVDGELKAMNDSKKSSEYTIRQILKYDDSTLLILTSNKGLFKYDKDGLTFWDTELSRYLIDRPSYKLLQLKGEYMAIGTLRDGVLVMNHSGELIQRINKGKGLNSDTIYCLFQDSTGMLWIGMSVGVNLIHIASPFTFIDERHGLDGGYSFAQIHQNMLYVSGDAGIFRKDLSKPWQSLTNNDPIYHYSQNREADSWFLMEVGKDLFLGSSDGLFLVKENRLELVAKIKCFSAVSLPNSNALVVNAAGRLELVLKENGIWKYKWPIKSGLQEYDFMYALENGHILASESNDGIFRIQLNTQLDSVEMNRQYTKNDGLPANENNRIYRHSDNILVTTVAGIFQLDLAQDKMIRMPEYETIEETPIFRLPADSSGNIFLASLRRELHYLKKTDTNEYAWISSPFIGLKKYTPEFILPVNEQNTYILQGNGLTHYDASIPTKYDRSFNVLVRKVNTTTDGDSLIYGGALGSSKFILPFSENALSFEFSATYYDRREELLFQYKLEGFEEHWSDWDIATEKEYTNLPHGNLEFKVRAKNIYGFEGKPDSFKLYIQPPWYFTIYAYFGYSILFILFVWSIVKLNTRRLVREKRALEQVVLERTEEIREQKDSIEKQATKLKEMDKVKSRFFANISHELRTPITLINGPIEAILKGEHGDIASTLTEVLDVVKNNGNSMSKLVNEILDLTKLEAGKLKLIENPVLFYAFLNDLLDAHKSEIKAREIDFQFNFQYDQDGSLLLDEAKFAKIINNLLSNAFKFSPDNGKIIMTVKEVDEHLTISVKDFGHGIHSDDIEQVFDRFYQSEQPDTKIQGGTGIGLALSQELAKLHGGLIAVSSEMGKGSEFTFSFPKKIVESDVDETVNEEFNIDIINTDFEATITKYIDIFEIEKPVLLITEDHKEMREFIVQIVRPYFTILEAENGVKALELLKENKVDMIISDVMMPKMDGFELLENIKNDKVLNMISMIMLTARASEEDKLFALTLGVDDYLTKPFSRDELIVRTRNILNNRIVRKITENESSSDSKDLPNVDIEFINTIKNLVEKNMSDSLLTVAFLASNVAMSERQLLRKLKSLTGYSAIQFINEIKLQQAKKLLENKQVDTVAEASYQVGFDKVKYFSNQYIKRFGKRPSESLMV